MLLPAPAGACAPRLPRGEPSCEGMLALPSICPPGEAAGGPTEAARGRMRAAASSSQKWNIITLLAIWRCRNEVE